MNQLEADVKELQAALTAVVLRQKVKERITTTPRNPSPPAPHRVPLTAFPPPFSERSVSDDGYSIHQAHRPEKSIEEKERQLEEIHRAVNASLSRRRSAW